MGTAEPSLSNSCSKLRPKTGFSGGRLTTLRVGGGCENGAGAAAACCGGCWKFCWGGGCEVWNGRVDIWGGPLALIEPDPYEAPYPGPIPGPRGGVPPCIAPNCCIEGPWLKLRSCWCTAGGECWPKGWLICCACWGWAVFSAGGGPCGRLP